MLSDEEKKAIEYWKTHMEILHWNTQLASEHYIKVLLDLIEKQSKEIEELKQKEKQAYIDGTNIADQLCNKKWEDKIKAKIEEVHYKMIGHQDLREAVKRALQSLLEKE